MKYMPLTGRPPLTADALQARIEAYCRTYAVAVAPSGLPPFPSGQRETPQHRAWMSIYKAHGRVTRRAEDDAALADVPQADREVIHASQDGRCPICAEAVDLHAAVDGPSDPAARRLLHAGCRELVARLRPLGPEGLDRLRAYLWSARGYRKPKT